jgi:enterochelin esterase-like enzyme
MPYSVYLPPGYGSSDRHYPVLYLLHGYFGNYVEWADVGIQQTADRLILAAAIQPMIIVMPEGEQSYYVNHGQHGPRWGDYMLQDVIRVVDSTFRTIPQREARAVGGLSMGGHAALQLAFRNPDVFAIVGAHSPTLRWDRPEDKFAFADDAYYEKVSPLHLARDRDGLDQLHIWIDVGEDDWNWFWVEELHDQLDARGIDHEFVFLGGGHDAEYWIEYRRQYLLFYDAAFQSFVAAGFLHVDR